MQSYSITFNAYVTNICRQNVSQNNYAISSKDYEIAIISYKIKKMFFFALIFFILCADLNFATLLLNVARQSACFDQKSACSGKNCFKNRYS